MRSSVILEHPCFQEKCHGQFGRIHLPVAPKCTIQCAFCDRKYDCVNESRPGVASKIITPKEALERTAQALQKEPRIRVAGIAGPGDPLVNRETFETLFLLRKAYPDLTLCTSTNGLMLEESVDELKEAGLDTLTVTVNAASVGTAEKIYLRVAIPGREENSDPKELLEEFLERQQAGLLKSCEKGLTVKVNTVLIPGVNEKEIDAIARMAQRAGAAVMNIMPMIPCGKMSSHRAPTQEELGAARMQAASWMRQFTFCRQCRADACGVI